MDGEQTDDYVSEIQEDMAVSDEPSGPPESDSVLKHISRCPQCGLERTEYIVDEDAQAKIKELELRIRRLTEEAAESAQKLAFFENSQARSSTPTPSYGYKEEQPLPALPATTTATTTTDEVPAIQRSRTVSRFSSFLGRRKPSSATPILHDPTSTTSAPAASPAEPRQQEQSSFVTAREHELVAEVSEERTKRQEAESTAERLRAEMEDLSAELFKQANEMVATEREARAKLEDRVKVLEDRDLLKRQRLETLETEMNRIERLRKTHFMPKAAG